jgi:allantoinase
MTTNPRVPFELATDRKVLPAPEGKHVIVHVVVNVENWRFDSPMPRKIITPPHGIDSVPDVPNFAWAEYGMRCGMPRIFRALAERDLPATCALNAGVIDTYPRLAEAIRDAGWEFMGHGLHQKAMHTEDSEAETIKRALDMIASFCGRRVRGWLGPGLRQTLDTPDILKAEQVDYCCDWCLDDLPTWMATKHGPLICMPYTLEINDSIMHAVQHYSSTELEMRVEDTLKTFERERHLGPRVLTLGLHPHLVAVPHRIGYLETVLDMLASRDDTIFMTGSQIADWFLRVEAN